MADFSKEDAVRILENLDAMSAAHIPDERRAWAHLFIALALIQKVLPSPLKLERERWLWLCGKVYDKVFEALANTKIGAQA